VDAAPSGALVILKKVHHAEEDTFSFLEFGSISRTKGKKDVYDYRTDQEAYDWFMLGRYSRDLVSYLELTERISELSLEELSDSLLARIHHSSDFRLNLAKLAAINVVQQPTFFEFGQTLFGCIEGMGFCRSLLHQCAFKNDIVALEEVDWRGYDTSEFFNCLAKIMHKNYSLSTTNKLESLEITGGVAFAKGVTLLYALQELKDLDAWSQRCELAVFDYSFALGAPEVTAIGTGKEVTYLSLDDFLSIYDPNRRPFLVRGNSRVDEQRHRVFIEGVWGHESRCHEFVELEKQYWDALGPGCKRLSEIEGDERSTWTEFSEYVHRLKLN